MKKFLIAALATTLIAGPIVAAVPADAQVRHTERTVRHKPNGTVVVRKQTVRTPARQTYRTNWRRGERFDRRQARNYGQINDWRQYKNRRLYAPQRGQQWVRSGNDAVLITVASGVIGAVLAGAFN